MRSLTQRLMLSRLAVLAFLATIVLTMTSCADTPSKRWAQGQETVISFQNLASQQAEQGRLSDQNIVTIDLFFQSARQALQVSEQMLPEGGKSFEQYLNVIDSILGKLAEILGQPGVGKQFKLFGG